jgi:hypothetical protein
MLEWSHIEELNFAIFCVGMYLYSNYRPPNHPQTLIQPQWLLIPTFYVNNLIQAFPLSAYPDLNVYTYKPRPDLLLPIQAQKFNLFPVSILITHTSTTNANTRS